MGIKRTLPTSNRSFRLIQVFKLKCPMILLSSLLFQVLSVHFLLFKRSTCSLWFETCRFIFQPSSTNLFVPQWRWKQLLRPLTRPCASCCLLSTKPDEMFVCSCPFLKKKKYWRNIFPLRSVSGQDNHPKHLCFVYTVAFTHFSTLRSVYLKKNKNLHTGFCSRLEMMPNPRAHFQAVSICCHFCCFQCQQAI